MMEDKVLSLSEKRKYFKEQKKLAFSIASIISTDIHLRNENIVINDLISILTPFTISFSNVYLEWKRNGNDLLETLIHQLRVTNNEIYKIDIKKNKVSIDFHGKMPSKISISNNLNVTHNLHVNSLIKFKYGLFNLPSFFLEKKNKNFKIQRKFNIPVSNDEKEILKILAFAFLPTVFLENFLKLYKSINWGELESANKQNIYSSHGIHDNHLHNLLFHMIKSKKKLIFKMFQHGGTYFLQKNFITLDLENLYVDKYFVWGKNNNQLNSESIFYSKRNIWFLFLLRFLRYFFKKNKILLVLPAFHDRDYRYDDFFQSSSYKILVKELSVIFNYTQKGRYVIHPYNNQTSKKFLSDLSLIEFDSNVSIYKSLITSQLIIISYNSTVLAEALLTNTPFIIYLNEDRDGFNMADKKLFNEIKVSGVFHTTPESLNHFLSLYSYSFYKLKNWWKSDIVRKAIKGIKNQYLGL